MGEALDTEQHAVARVSLEAVTIHYYTFDLGDRTAGLLRRTIDTENKTDSIASVKNGEWIDDPDAFRYFESYGGDQLDVVELSVEAAQARAAELDVSL